MPKEPATAPDDDALAQDGDLSDLLEELRILLPGTQTLTAFLIILPFNGGFKEIREEQKVVYVVTFLCSVVALLLFIAPAAHHRLQRPLRDRVGFKNRATRYMIAGLVPLSIAIVLAVQLVLSTVFEDWRLSWPVAAALGFFVALLWWIIPIRKRDEARRTGR